MTCAVFMVAIRFIVKIGGAAVTDKASFETLNGSVLCDVAEQLKQVYAQNPIADFVVVHGAGSFGHFQASRADVHRGGVHKAAVRTGFVESRWVVVDRIAAMTGRCDSGIR